MMLHDFGPHPLESHDKHMTLVHTPWNHMSHYFGPHPLESHDKHMTLVHTPWNHMSHDFGPHPLESHAATTWTIVLTRIPEHRRSLLL